MTATGTGALLSVNSNDVHTVAVIVTGSPSAATVNLEGSLDSTHWFDLSGDQDASAGDIMFHVVYRAVAFVRPNVSALSGGTSPTLVISYLGHESGGDR